MANSLDFDKSFKLGDDIVYRIVEDEAIVLDVAKGEHFTLNKTATEILKMIDEGKTLRMILGFQNKKYISEIESLEPDLVGFVEELIENEILVN